MDTRILAAARASFAMLLAFTLVNALQPGPGQLGELNDKLWHFLAFYVLALNAACAAPGVRLILLAAGLIGLGGLIEALQLLPQIGRSGSLFDVMADVAGIAAALGPVLVLQWRSRWGAMGPRSATGSRPGRKAQA